MTDDPGSPIDLDELVEFDPGRAPGAGGGGGNGGGNGSGAPHARGDGAEQVTAAASAGEDSAGQDGAEGVDDRADDPADDPADDLADDLADDAALESALEALLLVVDEPADEETLAAALEQPTTRVATALRRMSQAYTDAGRGFDLRRSGGGWRFYTRDVHAPYVEKLLLGGQRAKLTRAALETLAVVAYRQPVTRARVSAVRGVNCDGVLRTLLTRGLIEEAGVDPSTQGTLFRTTELFLERLGLSSLDELPPIAPLLPDVDAIDEL